MVQLNFLNKINDYSVHIEINGMGDYVLFYFHNGKIIACAYATPSGFGHYEKLLTVAMLNYFKQNDLSIDKKLEFAHALVSPFKTMIKFVYNKSYVVCAQKMWDEKHGTA